jgi:hypothetical protein
MQEVYGDDVLYQVRCGVGLVVVMGGMVGGVEAHEASSLSHTPPPCPHVGHKCTHHA